MKIFIILLLLLKTISGTNIICDFDSSAVGKLNKIINICDPEVEYDYIDRLESLNNSQYVGINVVKKDEELHIVRTSFFKAEIDSESGYGYNCDTIQYDTVYNYKTPFQYSIIINGNISKNEIKTIIANFLKYPFENENGQIGSISKAGKNKYQIFYLSKETAFYNKYNWGIIFNYTLINDKIKICKDEEINIDVICPFIDKRCYEIKQKNAR